MKKNELSFEEAIRELERISSELEQEKTGLDESLGLYEEGVKLVRYCNKMLEDAERKIKILSVNADGEIEEKDFIGAVDTSSAE